MKPVPYTELQPFREFFQTGWPILTYHKLGPRPRHVRLKGLYMEAALFARQLSELRQAGFQTGRLSDFPPAPAGKSIVLTFDDGFRNVLDHGLGPLAENKFTAIQFLVADRLGQSNLWDLPAGEAPEDLMDPAQVREWLAAGHTIGSHSLTHPRLTQIEPAQAREEIVASKKKLEDRFGCPVEHFCYPYGRWNAAVRDLVAEAGYRTAVTTDFGINSPATSPFALLRITARYRSRRLTQLPVISHLLKWLPGRART